VKEDGRYVIINQDGRSIPLKMMTVQKDVPEPKKYVVKSEHEHFLIGIHQETNVYSLSFLLASSGQVISMSSPSSVKLEKPSTSSGSIKTIGPASAITIGGRKSGGESSGNVIKIVSPTSPSSSGNVKVVRVVTSGGTTQKVIQVQKPQSAPRILNQTWSHANEVKSEPAQSRAITVVRKSDGSVEPPAKKTKYITLTSSQISQIEGATIINDGERKRVMLPTNYREQLEKLSVTSPTKNSGQVFKIVQDVKKPALEIDPLDMNKSYPGMKKPKRPCNCTKSQCLKFYCDCFAAGEYCVGCNCKDCLNEHDTEEREKAVKLCMERNPFAFK
jgi:hypothetical protein